MSTCHKTNLAGNSQMCVPAGWSTGMQGQCRRPFKGAEWSAGMQSSYAQNRCMGEPQNFLMGPLTAESVDIHQASRMRTNTHIPVAPQTLAKGSNLLQLPSSAHMSTSAHMSNTSMTYLLSPPDHNTENLGMQFAPSTYCHKEYKNCLYTHGRPHVGAAQDGCVHSSESCSKAMNKVEALEAVQATAESGFQNTCL